jgi:hypothetical protein
MPGVPGAGGPVPKRSDQRRRRNKESKPESVQVAAPLPAVPVAAKGWHPVARAWYESLGKSGQAVFYEPSDWATAYLLAESMSRELKPQFVGMRTGFDEQGRETSDPVIETLPMKGASLSAYLKAMTALLVTEGDRRRASLELDRAPVKKPADGSDVAELDAYRRRVAG